MENPGGGRFPGSPCALRGDPHTLVVFMMYMYNFVASHLCRICLGLEDSVDLLARVAEGHT